MMNAVAAGPAISGSVLNGGPQPIPAQHSLGELLLSAAERDTGRIGILDADGAPEWLSYSDLLADAGRVLAGIREHGLPDGSVVVLRLARAADLLAAFWACVLGGYLPLPLDPAAQPGTDFAALRAAAPGAGILGEPAGDSAPPEGLVPLGPAHALRRRSPDRRWSAGRRRDPAVLLRTAGSTGAAKTVVLTHRNILSRSAGTIAVNGMTARSRTLNWMPLDHVGGLVMFHLRDTLLGCTQLHAPREWILADPLRWLDLVDRHRIDTSWATSSAYDLIGERVAAHPERSWDLRSLRYLMNGGEPVRARGILEFTRRLAPFGLAEDAVRPGWGMSETSSGVVDLCLAHHRLGPDDRYVPVGVPHPGVSVRVVGDNGDVLPEGAVGRLEVAGDAVTPGYLSPQGPDRRSFTADGWFRTGDMAFVSGGALTVTGSADDVVRIGGGIWHGHEIEAAIAADVPFVERRSVAAVGLPDGGSGDDALAVFCDLTAATDAHEAARLVRQAVARRFGITVSRVVALEQSDFPRTRTGKPMRSALRARIAGEGEGP